MAVVDLSQNIEERAIEIGDEKYGEDVRTAVFQALQDLTTYFVKNNDVVQFYYKDNTYKETVADVQNLLNQAKNLRTSINGEIDKFNAQYNVYKNGIFGKYL